MILNDEQLLMAQKAVENLQKILLEARKIHSKEEYRAMSEPVLLEIQQREQQIIDYLTKTQKELSLG
ncbi:MAG: hypothetical protein COZ69_16430 [Deltaproteobacteria bacterium CG_4_8_14_3_um_filter_45_9]|jgi:hypothetical protein|nr:MAG: hypothetical protein COS40_10325 [Deltaproteobacteria bacterium CG03_land_8_20_14_0_80_45_14]PIX21134.1 MAG: hypothetical protein COZ69_16430 [Deltaproteobacteria bacterium CG_4_8_14_3_um_filter_45_9]